MRLRAVRTALVVAVAVALSGCASESSSADAELLDAGLGDTGWTDTGLPDSGPAEDATPGDATPDAGPGYLTTLESAEALAGLLAPEGDVKYLAPVVGRPVRAPITEPCYFQNMQLYPYHLLFLRSFPELASLGSSDYADLVLRRPTRIWWGGGVKYYPNTPHPIAGQGVIAWTVYHEVAGADRLGTDDVVAVHELLAGCVRFAPELLAFLPTDPYQVTFARAERQALAAMGIAIILPEELR